MNVQQQSVTDFLFFKIRLFPENTKVLNGFTHLPDSDEAFAVLVETRQRCVEVLQDRQSGLKC